LGVFGKKMKNIEKKNTKKEKSMKKKKQKNTKNETIEKKFKIEHRCGPF
jgi:hypothetical protein